MRVSGSSIVSALCIMGGLSLIGLNLYEMGVDHGRLERVKCEPRVIYRVDSYSPTELRRIASARERMEKVK